MFCIRTRSPIDDLIGGGIPTGMITHIYGEAATGKTTLAMQAAGHLSEEGYQTLYIDCDNRFSFERFSQMFPDEDLLERLILIVPRSLSEQTEILSVLDAYVSNRTRLIVLDTISSQYRRGLSPETRFARYREVVEKQLPEMLGLCRRRRNVAVLVLNQVVSRLDLEGGCETVPSTGWGLNKFCQVTLRLSSVPVRSVREAEIIDHYLELKGRVYYRITNEGISFVDSECLKTLREVGENVS
ncbi:MAG: ATPase domain-containing protein [Candidatus Freyarchaeota archaeon]